ncbi:MAG: ankyrin repeat domain-containing protein [Alphaproteobacteria bacterium]|nr:ankyrin repeat domain-containing protein [Alphaproteobacteria bacterium]
MPPLRQSASDSFARKPARAPKAGYGAGGLRKSRLAAACDEVLQACGEGDAEALQRTLAQHAEILPDIVNARDDSGWTALHVAVSWCAEDCIDVLLNTGANPDICNHQGQNPHDLACQLGYASIAAHIVPIPGAAEAAVRTAHRAQLSAEIRMITEGFPRSITITCCKISKDLRRPH